MNIFVIFRVSDPVKMEAALKEAYPSNHLIVHAGEWLVAAASATAKEVSDSLGISDAQNGTAIVMRMGSYYGRGPSDIWEWVKVKSEASGE